MTVSLVAAESGDGPPVAILHGLFGSGRNWASIAQRLAPWFRVIAFDLRNHGNSPWADEMDYTAMAEDVRAALAARGHRRASLIGHSMGGKVAMMAALDHPDEIERLVVVDIAPVAYPSRHIAYVQAMRALDPGMIARRADADTRLADAVPDAAERGFLLQNLIFKDGRARWRLNLAAIERAMPKLSGFPRFSSETAYTGPTLFLAGAGSNYVRPEHETSIKRLFPAAEIARIGNAGHWVHAEQPALFVDQIRAFLVGETR